jgi:hypothetical protein
VSLFLAWVPEANSIISTSGIPFTETFLEFISDDETRKTDPYASYIYSVSGAQANTVDWQVKFRARNRRVFKGKKI